MAAIPPPPAIAMPAVDIEPPTIGNALRNRVINVVDEQNILRQERAYLMQDTAPSQAYQKWPNKTVHLPHGKGELVYCQVLLRDPSSPQLVFRKSDMTVIIKKLRRQLFDPAIQEHENNNGPPLNENPYNEIAVMQQYGYLPNIMECYEALMDTHYLYIIMLWLREGDLHSHILHQLGGGYQPANQIRVVATRLVENLQFLQQHALVHRDLKPQNCMLKPPWFPFIDFAMTLRAAIVEETLQYIHSRGPAGSESYISPEVFFNLPFNHKVDVWAFGCILWELLTGQRLYRIPSDVSFTFFIRAGGLTNENMCEEVLEQLLQHDPNHDLVPRLQAIQVLTPIKRDLLARILQENPENRPSLDDILPVIPFL